MRIVPHVLFWLFLIPSGILSQLKLECNEDEIAEEFYKKYEFKGNESETPDLGDIDYLRLRISNISNDVLEKAKYCYLDSNNQLLIQDITQNLTDACIVLLHSLKVRNLNYMEISSEPTIDLWNNEIKVSITLSIPKLELTGQHEMKLKKTPTKCLEFTQIEVTEKFSVGITLDGFGMLNQHIAESISKQFNFDELLKFLVNFREISQLFLDKIDCKRLGLGV
uniref:MW2416 protein n=1 Tax=Fopius arisanus TaxID=64838 RepID=A0A0C9R495_9HYME